MVENIVSKYLVAKFDAEEKPPDIKKHGFVVTISRETGCDALRIANTVVEKLNQDKGGSKWRLISKEILEKSAKKLKVDPSKLDEIMSRQEQNVFEEIIMSFSGKSYPNDIKIKNTIRNVIKNLAQNGNVIIIGRGGVGITHDFPKSLHIKFLAPMDWRIKNIAKRKNFSRDKAEEFVHRLDIKRKEMRQFYLQKNDDITDYDIAYNVGTLKPEEVVDSISNLIASRQN